ncbi:MAG TPA: hypothetical protein DCE41_29310 [Cytophagales bacterium]|nr:hypothetical protein [Cytophagales bacterium]HAA24477.1 hypothetical protein [Cytophagales bacterium]
MRFRGTVMLMVCGLLGLGRAEAAEWLKDSIRVEVQDGKRYVIHKVESGETVYRLALRYGVSQGDLMKANPILAQGLKVNQIIQVPLGGTATSASPASSSNATVHVVAPGEGLFRIAQKYDVSQADIRDWNNLTSDNLAIGQELLIKGVARSSTSSTNVPSTTQNHNSEVDNSATTHVVVSGETLYSISQKYGVTAADLRIWNNLPNSNIGAGQTLAVKAPAEEDNQSIPAAALTPTPPASTETQVADNSGQENNASEESSPSNTTPATPQPDAANSMPSTGMPTRVAESVRDLSSTEDEANSTGYRKMYEKGLCEVIDGSSETKKYLAMHATAPIGTIMEVRNEMNDLKVFVRVVARLPQTTDNERLLLKISNAAYERLGAADKRFPIEISYIP